MGKLLPVSRHRDLSYDTVYRTLAKHHRPPYYQSEVSRHARREDLIENLMFIKIPKIRAARSALYSMYRPVACSCSTNHNEYSSVSFMISRVAIIAVTPEECSMKGIPEEKMATITL